MIVENLPGELEIELDLELEMDLEPQAEDIGERPRESLPRQLYDVDSSEKDKNIRDRLLRVRH